MTLGSPAEPGGDPAEGLAQVAGMVLCPWRCSPALACRRLRSAHLGAAALCCRASCAATAARRVARPPRRRLVLTTGGWPRGRRGGGPRRAAQWPRGGRSGAAARVAAAAVWIALEPWAIVAAWGDGRPRSRSSTSARTRRSSGSRGARCWSMPAAVRRPPTTSASGWSGRAARGRCSQCGTIAITHGDADHGRRRVDGKELRPFDV